MYNKKFNSIPFTSLVKSPPAPITVTVTASDTAYNMTVDYLYEGDLAATRKDFKLYKNKLDGSFIVIDPAGPRGWTSASYSGIDGKFTQPPSISIVYSTVTLLPGLGIDFDAINQVYPSNIEVNYYQGTTLLGTDNFSNASSSFSFSNTAGLYVDKITIVFLETALPNSPIYINRIGIADSEQYTDTGIIFSSMEELIEDIYRFSDSEYISSTENEHLTVYAPGIHTDYIYSAYTDSIENIHTAMNKDERQVFGKVTITYTEAFSDDSLEMSVDTGTAHSTDLLELTDDIEYKPYKWFSLHDNKLDGSYKLMPSFNNKNYSVGWWGKIFSNSEGMFDNPTTITITFTPRTISSLSLFGTAAFDNYPVDFKINVYRDTDLIYEEEVINNTEVNWFKRIEPKLVGVTRYTVTITRISKANDTIKLTSLYTAIRETYYNDAISSIGLLEEVGYSTGSLPIGNISANEIDIVLDNSDRRFDLNNTESALYGYVKRNRKVQAWLGAEVAGEIEWAPIGTFWTTQWDIPRNQLYASLVARDRLELLRLTDFTKSPIYIDNTLYDLFEIVLRDAGVADGGYRIDESLKSIIIPYAWFDNVSHREALQRLAGCAIIQVYCDKRDVINVHWSLDTSANYTAVFDDDTNIFSSSYPLAVAEQINYIEVTYRQYNESNVTELFKGYFDDYFAPNSTKTISVSFSKKPVVSILDIDLSSSYLQLVSYDLYSYGIDLHISNPSTTLVAGVNIVIMGTALEATGERTAVTQDSVAIREDGKIQQQVSHDFIQSQLYAQSLSEDLLEIFKESRYDVTMENRGNVAVELGDKVLVNDAIQNVTTEYAVTRQSIQWDGTLSATTSAKRL